MLGLKNWNKKLLNISIIVSVVIGLLYVGKNCFSSKSDRMHSLLIQAEQMNQSFIMMDTVRFMPDVVDYFKCFGTDVERLRAYYMLGCVYRDQGNSHQALACYHDAISQVDTLSSNLHQVSRIYGQIASLFHQQCFPHKEIQAWKESRKYALKANDSLMATYALSMMGNVYMQLNMSDSAYLALKLAPLEYKQMGRNDLAASSLGSRIWFYFQCDSLTLAKKDIDEYIVESGFVDGNGNVSSGREILFYFQGLYYEKIHSLDSALYYYRKLISFPEDLQNLENGYKGLMTVFGAKNQNDSVKLYAELYTHLNDLANQKKSANSISRTEMLYNYSISQTEASKKSIEVNRLWQIFYHITFFIVVAIIVLILFIRHINNVNKTQLSLMNHDYNEVLSKYTYVMSELDQMKVDSKEVVLKKEQEINELRRILMSYQENMNPDRWNIEQCSLNHELVRQFHTYATKIIVPTEHEWERLIDVVSDLLPDFYHHLTQAGTMLSARELKVCILIRLHFIPSEVAVLLNLTKQHVTNIRREINRKLFQQNGAKKVDQNLSNF